MFEQKYWRIIFVIALGAIFFLNIHTLACTLVCEFLGLNANTALGKSLLFFTIKFPTVLLLIMFFVFVQGYFRSYFPEKRLFGLLVNQYGLAANLHSAMLAVVTHFGTYDSVQFMMNLSKRGINIGVIVSFLISISLVNEVMLIVMFVFFGWEFTISYFFTALIIASLAGNALNYFHPMRYLHRWFERVDEMHIKKEAHVVGFIERVSFAQSQVDLTLKRFGLYLFVGVAIASFMHGYLAANFIVQTFGAEPWYSLFIALFIGLFLMTNPPLFIPILAMLLFLGMSPGFVLVLLMSSLVFTYRELFDFNAMIEKRLIVLYLSMMYISILGSGIVMNILV